jgi:hypothetical protein
MLSVLVLYHALGTLSGVTLQPFSLYSIPILYSGLYIRFFHGSCRGCDGVAIMQHHGRGRPRSMGPSFRHRTVVRDYTIITEKPSFQLDTIIREQIAIGW